MMNFLDFLNKQKKVDKKKPVTNIHVKVKGDGRSEVKVSGNTSFSALVTPELERMSFRKINAMHLYLENMRNVKNGPLDVVGRRAVSMIRTRMVRGKDIEGADFAPLSKSYAKKKEQYYRRGKFGNKPVQQPPMKVAKPPKSNLFLTGGLYRSVQYWKVNANGNPAITIGVNKDKGFAAMLHHGRFNMPPRPFIGLSNQEIGVLSRLFKRELTINLGKEILRTR